MAEPEPRRQAPPVSREEFEELRQRLLLLEALLAGKAGPALEQPPPAPPEGPRPVPVRTEPSPHRDPPPAPPAAEVARPAPRVPFDGTGRRVPSVAKPAEEVAASKAQRATRPLTERLAPRLGALLVFLASVFFLGVSIERGWVGPVAQLLLGAAAGASLVGAGAWLASRRGYGPLPLGLEAGGVCLLFAAAFVSTAVPYYRDATGMDPLIGGLLMASVAGGIAALGLQRGSRALLALGYGLSFLTAGLGLSVLPYLSLVHVTVLGTSLAWLVVGKDWNAEALAGSLTTGGFFVAFAFGSAPAPPEGPAPALVALASLMPLTAFLYLALRPDPTRSPDDPPRELPPLEAWSRLASRLEAATQEVHPWAILAAATMGWGILVTVRPFFDPFLPVAAGLALLAWCLFALSFTLTAARRRAVPSVTAVLGFTALVLQLVWPPIFWGDSRSAALASTATYAVTALTVLAFHLRRPDAPWGLHAWAAGLVLTAAAVFRAVFVDGHLPTPGLDAVGDAVLGNWRAFAVLIPILAATALLVITRGGNLPPHPYRIALGMGAGLAGVWAFALLRAPLYSTIYLVALGVACGLVALLVPHRPEAAPWRASLPRDAFLAALGFTGAAAYLALFLDGHVVFGGATDAILGPWTAFLLFPFFAAAAGLLTVAPAAAVPEPLRRAGFALGAGFLLLWGFALFHHPLFATIYLVALGGGLAVGALLLAPATEAAEDRRPLAEDAFLAGLVILGIAAVKALLLDFMPDARLPWTLALAETGLVAAALLGLHQACRVRGAPLRIPSAPLDAALVTGAAAVLASLALAYGPGPWGSVALALLGVAFMGAGFVRRAAEAYRVSGLALLALALARVAVVDLAEADLLPRFLVFGAMALLALAVGVLYALKARRERPRVEEAIVIEPDRP